MRLTKERENEIREWANDPRFNLGSVSQGFRELLAEIDALRAENTIIVEVLEKLRNHYVFLKGDVSAAVIIDEALRNWLDGWDL